MLRDLLRDLYLLASSCDIPWTVIGRAAEAARDHARHATVNASPADTAGGGAGQVGLYRLFGDATGNGVVDLADLAAFRGTFNQTAPNAAYLAYLDADNSGTVDLADLSEFRSRFNQNLFTP